MLFIGSGIRTNYGLYWMGESQGQSSGCYRIHGVAYVVAIA